MFSVLMLIPVLPIFLLSFFAKKEDSRDFKYAYLVLLIPGTLFLSLSLLEEYGGFTHLGNRYGLLLLFPSIFIGIAILKSKINPVNSGAANFVLIAASLVQYVPAGLFIGLAFYVGYYIYLIVFYFFRGNKSSEGKQVKAVSWKRKAIAVLGMAIGVVFMFSKSSGSVSKTVPVDGKYKDISIVKTGRSASFKRNRLPFNEANSNERHYGMVGNYISYKHDRGISEVEKYCSNCFVESIVRTDLKRGSIPKGTEFEILGMFFVKAPQARLFQLIQKNRTKYFIIRNTETEEVYEISQHEFEDLFEKKNDVKEKSSVSIKEVRPEKKPNEVREKPLQKIDYPEDSKTILIREEVKDCLEAVGEDRTKDGQTLKLSLIKILMTGCKGRAVIKGKKVLKGNVSEIDIDADFISSSDDKYGSPILRIEQTNLGGERSRFGSRLDLGLPTTENKNFLPTELGKRVRNSVSKSGGTLEKGTRDYDYRVLTEKSGKIRVCMRVKVINKWNHMPSSEEKTVELQALCPSALKL